MVNNGTDATHILLPYVETINISIVTHDEADINPAWTKYWKCGIIGQAQLSFMINLLRRKQVKG